MLRELAPKEVPENDTHLYEDEMLEEDLKQYDVDKKERADKVNAAYASEM